jgi:hypothetical protein
MLINELSDLHCEACGDEVDVRDAAFEAVTPLLCPDCQELISLDEADLEIAEAA